MSSIADVLRWKFPDEPIIETVNDNLTRFSGPMPTADDLFEWRRDYDLYLAKQIAVIQLNDTLIKNDSLTVDYNGNTFKSDEEAQNKLSNAIVFLNGGKLPDGFFWPSIDDTHIPFTVDDLKGLATAIFTQTWTSFQKLQDKKAQIDQATSAGDIAIIVSSDLIAEVVKPIP